MTRGNRPLVNFMRILGAQELALCIYLHPRDHGRVREATNIMEG